MQAKTIPDRVEELARLQTVLAAKCARVNAALPAIDASPGERQAYQLLYDAKNEAERAVQSAALKLAFDAPGLLADTE